MRLDTDIIRLVMTTPSDHWKICIFSTKTEKTDKLNALLVHFVILLFWLMTYQAGNKNTYFYFRKKSSFVTKTVFSS